MDELLATLRETIAALASADPGRHRFGAAHHRYELAPALAEPAVAAIETRLGVALPEDYRAYVCRLSAGGAGPYYGLLPADRAAAFPIEAPAGPGTATDAVGWRRALPIAHLGCGYAALLALDGPARGQVWIDARALGVVTPIRSTFTAFYVDWIERLAGARWLEGFVPPGRCGLAAAVTGYLGYCEQRLGIAAGTLDGDPLRDALGELGPGAIELAAEGPLALFAPGDRVDPCVTCACWLEGLATQGLRPGVVAPGARTLPER